MNVAPAMSPVAEPGVHLARRELLIGGSLLAGAAAGLAFAPHRTENLLGSATLDDLVPTRFGGWRFDTISGLVLPPADELRDRIYSQLLTRVYLHDGKPPVMLLIAYSAAQDGTLQIHRPEICYPASGYRLTRLARHVIPVASGRGIPSRTMWAQSDVRSEQVMYWTRIGRAFPTNWSEQYISVVGQSIAGITPDGILVRISSAGTGISNALLDAFARNLYQSADPQLRRVLFGLEDPDLRGSLS